MGDGGGAGRFPPEAYAGSIEIAFKKEGLFGEEVVIRTEIDGLVTLHGIYADDDNRELAKIRIRWK